MTHGSLRRSHHHPPSLSSSVVQSLSFSRCRRWNALNRALRFALIKDRPLLYAAVGLPRKSCPFISSPCTTPSCVFDSAVEGGQDRDRPYILPPYAPMYIYIPLFVQFCLRRRRDVPKDSWGHRGIHAAHAALQSRDFCSATIGRPRGHAIK